MPSASPLSAGTLAAECGGGAAGSPRVIRSAATDQRCISERSSLALSVWSANDARHSAACWGVVMPRWWAPKNGIDSRVAVALAVTSPTASPAASPAAPPAATAAPALAAIPAAPADAAIHGV